MKKIIVSAAVAAMALSTTASALEDIKVNGQAKVWYETNDASVATTTNSNDMFHKDRSSAEVAMKLGMTGKQGNVAFEGEMTYGTTMGLENELVMAARTNAVQNDLFVSKFNVTVPLIADTAVKLGRQELNTPLAFTEKWNAIQNNFDAAVLVNSSVTNLTLIGAYVGQSNANVDGSANPYANAWRAESTFEQMHGGAFAAAALYNDKTVAVNAWYYHVNDTAAAAGARGLGLTALGAVEGIGTTTAMWIDAGVTMGDFNVKGYYASLSPDFKQYDDTTALALSASAKVADFTISAAASQVSDYDSNVKLGALPVGNVATGFKKTKLPTAGVYTDGLYVAQPDSTAIKVKAAGKLGSTGIAIQGIMNENDSNKAILAPGTHSALNTTEVDLIITQKLGDFNIKGILMNRAFENNATDKASGGNYIRVITSINF